MFSGSVDAIFEWVYGWLDCGLEEACPPGSRSGGGGLDGESFTGSDRAADGHRNISTSATKSTFFLCFALSHIQIESCDYCRRLLPSDA
ncbi:hypothetical protein CHARACLAT_015216 [Characodon lateralis]|uniref:Uncharacterized protein n=1 Tax=Characodon lateralis TaxID=208331 RepID=A0ABU7D1W7_9TELE|nr:hypothetical protein [Characodon lateralis]